MISDIPNRVVVWFQSIRWSRSDKIVGVTVGAFLAIVVACAGCAALGNAISGNTAQMASVSQPRTSSPHSTATPRQLATRRSTVAPLPTAILRPTATPISPATPLLGGDISAFVHAYGSPTGQSNLQGGDYHLREYPGSYVDYLILDTGLIVGDATTAQDVASILVQSPPNQAWSLAQVEQQCGQFLPSDAKYAKTYAPPANGNPGDLDIVYTSASLARVFPAKDFTDVNQNQTVDGSFDVSYMSFGSIGKPDEYDSCSIIIGEQQTQN